MVPETEGPVFESLMYSEKITKKLEFVLKILFNQQQEKSNSLMTMVNLCGHGKTNKPGFE